MYFFECLRISPKDSYLLNAIGKTCEEMENHKEAYDYYLKAIKTEPSKKDLWIDIIELLNNNRKEKNNQAVLKKALHHFPKDEFILKLEKQNKKIS